MMCLKQPIHVLEDIVGARGYIAYAVNMYILSDGDDQAKYPLQATSHLAGCSEMAVHLYTSAAASCPLVGTRPLFTLP